MGKRMKTNLLLRSLLLVMSGTLTILCQAATNRTAHLSHEARLLSELLSRTDTVGQRMARPVHDVNDSLLVHYGLSLIQILDVDEINQNIVINVWENHMWKDEFHTWDPSDYGGLGKVNLPPDLLWRPDIILYQNVRRETKGHDPYRLLLYSDGTIVWIPSVVYTSTCVTDMSNFPFDVQQCDFKFGSWSHQSSEIEITFYGNLSAVDLHDYLPNVEWNIQNTSAEHHRIFYTCCPDDKYSDLTFSLVLARRWMFYFMFLLLPAIILSCMSLMIFCIPPARPDRTGLGNSVMGSFMLLLILITQVSPPSENITFARYISCNMVLLGFSTLCSCAMVNLSLRTHPMTPTTRQVLLGPLATLLRVTATKRRTHLNPRTMSVHVTKTSNATGQCACANETPHQVKVKDDFQKETKDHQAEWQCAVRVLDRLTCIVYLFVLSVLFFLYFPTPWEWWRKLRE